MPRRLLRSTVRSLARGVDMAFAGTALNPPRAMRRSSPAESLGHDARVRGLAAISGFYHREAFLERPQEFFSRAAPIAPNLRRVRPLRGGEVLDLSWRSDFAPLWSQTAVAENLATMPADTLERIGLSVGKPLPELLAEFGLDKSGELATKYLGVSRNRQAHARWFRHDKGPRPAAVLLHGYMAGAFAVEERVWPVQKLFDAGLDVILTVLPFHGPRRSEVRGYRPPAFPSNDPRFTIEGFRQLVFDHQALFDYLLQGRVSGLGVMGMSLGGYSSGLLATLDERLQFAVLFVPLAAIDAFAHTHGRMVGDAEQQAVQREALRHAQWPVSPLARPAKVAGDRVVVIAGEADHVTGLEHGRQLATHFSTELKTFEGGHLLQFGRARAFAPVWEMLARQQELARVPVGES